MSVEEGMVNQLKDIHDEAEKIVFWSDPSVESQHVDGIRLGELRMIKKVLYILASYGHRPT